MLSIRKKLEERSYASISIFSAELAGVFTSEIGVQPAGDTAELQMQISGRAPELSLEQREKRKLAKRIIKAIQPGLEDAVMKESELNRKPFEKELKDLDQIFEFSVRSRRNSVAGSAEPGNVEEFDEKTKEGGDRATTEPKPKEQPNPDEDHVVAGANAAQPSESLPEVQAQEAPETNMDTSEATQEPEKETTGVLASTEDTTGEVELAVNGDTGTQPSNRAHETQRAPPTPPLSFEEDHLHPLAQGGIQWYMEPFDPVGTTIHEERWTGRDVMRGMSEELSELDEDELQDLVDDELDDNKPTGAVKKATRSTAKEEPEPEPEPEAEAEAADDASVKVHRTRRRIVQRYNFG